MNQFEIELIEQTFERCFGLRNALSRKADELLERGAIESLAYQSGLRKDFIKNNLEEIRLLFP